MRFLKFTVMTLPLTLSGCFNSSHEDSGVFYNHPLEASPAPIPSSSPSEPRDFSCPVEPCLSEPSYTPPETAVIPEWRPSEGQLIRAGELVMELKNQQESIPTHDAMIKHVQINMGLTHQQAEMILAELDI